MPFVVQDDTGLIADANAYISVQYFKDYHIDRSNGIVDPATGVDFTDSKIQGAIVVATDYINAKPCFVTGSLTDTQTTIFPLDNGQGIPKSVKNATAEYALAQLFGGIELSAGFEVLNRWITSERSKVGPIEEEITYGRPANLATVRKVPVAERLLGPYLCNNDRFGSFSVFRG